MDPEEARTIGRRLKQIRNARGKSQEAIASEIVALANALEIAPYELTRCPEPAPGNGEGARVKAVRRALITAGRDDPAGQVVPVEVLQSRVEALTAAQRECRHDQAGHDLPELIRDLHTSLAAGRGIGELLKVAVLLHVQGTHGWLSHLGASSDLGWQAALLARQAARERGGSALLGLAAFGAANGLLAAGEFAEARAELNSVTRPTNSPESIQLAGMLALSHSLLADTRSGDVEAALDYATELGVRTGESNAYQRGFGPTSVGVWRMAVALNPRLHPGRQHHGEIAASVAFGSYPPSGVLGRLRPGAGPAMGRQDDAVEALRRAELISPARVQRHPFTRDVLAELLPRIRRDSPAGRELRRMTYRAGLPV
ncbi:MAG: XRE family transcriptional regulator [Pseudonocardiaceae bacterium]